MAIELSEHFGYKKLIRFTLPAIGMMMFTSVYSLADGLFVSNFLGETVFAAVNLVWPFLMILGAIGFMFGTGGSALVAKTMGEGKTKKAQEIFSLIIYAVIVLGFGLSVLGLCFLRPILTAQGIDGELLRQCLIYGRILLIFIPLFMLQFVFQSLLVMAEKPKFGFWVTLLAGIANIALDAWFIWGLKWGVEGAAWATVLGQGIGGGVPLVYFLFPNKSTMRLRRCRFDTRALAKVCVNGVSEFISNIAYSVVNILYNYQMMRFLGESGVAAYGIITYAAFLFMAVFFGYAVGVAPIISYHFGAKDKMELKSLFNKNIRLMGVCGVVMLLVAEIFARPVVRIFIGYNPELVDLTVNGFRIYAVSFLLAGFNVFFSALFTALNNGVVSAVISCCRTLLFESLCVVLIPMFFGVFGIWSATVTAEILALAVSLRLVFYYKKRYGYL